jgi:hypothetical protein
VQTSTSDGPVLFTFSFCLLSIRYLSSTSFDFIRGSNGAAARCSHCGGCNDRTDIHETQQRDSTPVQYLDGETRTLYGSYHDEYLAKENINSPYPDLKRELLSSQVRQEITELAHPTALRRFGAPFKSDYGEVAPVDSELPILRFIFVNHVRNFPFLDQAHEKEFWQDRLQVVSARAHPRPKPKIPFDSRS